MPQEPAYILLVFIGLAAGASSGIFGIGGGVIIVPALVYLLGYSQHAAIGTSLAVLLPPVAWGPFWNNYRCGNVNLRSAAIVAAGLFVGLGSARTAERWQAGPSGWPSGSSSSASDFISSSAPEEDARPLIPSRQGHPGRFLSLSAGPGRADHRGSGRWPDRSAS